MHPSSDSFKGLLLAILGIIAVLNKVSNYNYMLVLYLVYYKYTEFLCTLRTPISKSNWLSSTNYKGLGICLEDVFMSLSDKDMKIDIFVILIYYNNQVQNNKWKSKITKCSIWGRLSSIKMGDLNKLLFSISWRHKWSRKPSRKSNKITKLCLLKGMSRPRKRLRKCGTHSTLTTNAISSRTETTWKDK